MKKNYVQQNPDKFGIKRVLSSSTEKMLLSADRLDVYFETQSNMHVAVEVKPQTTPEEDVMRGIFQCVKEGEQNEQEKTMARDP